ncbi:MAG: type II toxin-antitoxin system RelB/DinJ family antitoxin [Opitutus sp.]|jgi:addiction module RelB/DinJ family antitoxin|nr:type II toxin-antitoxin system RelB/DinJ family antitoxin [Opitutus sp.]MCS6247766.1 type II toxin-antitoxin system RelB/DinJ family antitoxin [Opitutus sp.]MCS6274246.1 type II toxin-antitoxin system RelB/DinJ family antitoxin [Opitutus sp.]MCS6278009.1 type II toxin-antitoxin system RelB/DinJ family antitoxin [Opitutus sp.]MCS6298883.1 type II toxin-antitoxin system RelB/DinJ family antitoxin [Opitutus sp.]
MAATTLFRSRVPTARLRNAEKILARLGMKPSDAFNIFLAQIEIRKDFPLTVSTSAERLLTTEQQGKEWEEKLGAY